jgi:flagellar hook-basal body complex protein FliE
MAINFNPDISSMISKTAELKTQGAAEVQNKGNFGKAIAGYLQDVNGQQEQANTSITELLSGKNRDVNSVVASVAKADMSFKLLVGVRNKLVQAYQETMKMQI